MLVLASLNVQTMHGYGIAQHIQRLSRDVLRVEEGSLYPALQRMRQKGVTRVHRQRDRHRATRVAPNTVLRTD